MVIHQIKEVPVYDGLSNAIQTKKEKKVKEKKVKKEKKEKKRSKSSGSDDTILSVDQDEYAMIKSDKKSLKQFLAIIKVKANSLSGGLHGWFKIFDKNGNDEIEFEEFKNMLTHIGVDMELRLQIMLFLLFDRRGQGWFNYAEFSDIIQRRLKPNFMVIVRNERARQQIEGLIMRWPEHKPSKKEIEYRDRVEEVIVYKDKIIEKPVEKIVEREVIREVEKPVYIEKIVENKIYIDKP